MVEAITKTFVLSDRHHNPIKYFEYLIHYKHDSVRYIGHNVVIRRARNPQEHNDVEPYQMSLVTRKPVFGVSD